MSGLAGTPTSDQVMEALSRLEHSEVNMKYVGEGLLGSHTAAGCHHCIALAVLESALESCGMIPPKKPTAEEVTTAYNWLKNHGRPSACTGARGTLGEEIAPCYCPFCKAWSYLDAVLRPYVLDALGVPRESAPTTGDR